MGDMPGGSWRSGFVGLALIVTFLVCGIQFGGGEPRQSPPVTLVCHVAGNDYDCKERP